MWWQPTHSIELVRLETVHLELRVEKERAGGESVALGPGRRVQEVGAQLFVQTRVDSITVEKEVEGVSTRAYLIACCEPTLCEKLADIVTLISLELDDFTVFGVVHNTTVTRKLLHGATENE